MGGTDYPLLHRRFLQQARWTAAIRRRLLAQMSSDPAGRWIEIGAGTGALARELAEFRTDPPGVALDIDLSACRFGAGQLKTTRWLCGDAHRLPMRSRSCAAAFFHFVLLWLDDPRAAILEASRAVRRGGRVIALAEPDHASRIDHPAEFEEVGKRQTDALARQGADISLGRRLGDLFGGAGLEQVEVGVLGGEWRRQDDTAEVDLEWETLRSDLEGELTPKALDDLRERESMARSRGIRVLFVPTFYASGRVP